jgi:hypothetical protein
MRPNPKLAGLLAALLVIGTIPLVGCSRPREIDKPALDAKIKRKDLKG